MIEIIIKNNFYFLSVFSWFSPLSRRLLYTAKVKLWYRTFLIRIYIFVLNLVRMWWLFHPKLNCAQMNEVFQNLDTLANAMFDPFPCFNLYFLLLLMSTSCWNDKWQASGKVNVQTLDVELDPNATFSMHTPNDFTKCKVAPLFIMHRFNRQFHFMQQILKLSPQNIDDALLRALIDTNLLHLHITQNRNTPETALPCSAKAWSNFKRMVNDHPKIHLSAIDCDLLIQPEAPVHSITCQIVREN